MSHEYNWIKAKDYTPIMYEKAIVWSSGWHKPTSATFINAPTVDGRGNDVGRHTGWLLDGAGAFYEDFGYFSDNDILYYGIDAVQYVIPLRYIDTPDTSVIHGEGETP